MIGAIIGDIVGSRFEWHNCRKRDFELFSEKCHFTDDTVMSLAVAKAILKSRDIDGEPLEYNSIKYMQEMGRKYPHAGYGKKFKQWIKSKNPQPYHSCGNGAAMRVSPVAFSIHTDGFFSDGFMIVSEMSKVVTSVTHNHPEGIKGAEAVTFAIYSARYGVSKEDIKREIMKHYYPLDFSIDEIRKSYKFDSSCQGSVPQAIMAFLESYSFEDAIRTAVSIGGDSDTIAAITGSIAEAYYGVPRWMYKKAVGYLDNNLKSILKEFEHYFGNNIHH